MPDLVVVTATSLEANAVRRVMPLANVVRGGIALRELTTGMRARVQRCDLAISCGIGGAMRDLPTGTVLIPERVLRPDGAVAQCDPAFTARLRAAAWALGYEAVGDPLVTTPEIVTGERRAFWAQRGYAGADMESGLVDAPRVAVIRVVLDTPAREISSVWERPAQALLTLSAWGELPFLAYQGPRCARRAAQVLARAYAEYRGT